MVFELRNRYNADLFSSAVNFNSYKPENSDSFSKDLFDNNFKFDYLHSDSRNKFIRHAKRLFYFLFSQKIKQLLNYDAVIFSGNVMFIQRRLKRMINKTHRDIKLVMYCHTPPRKLTDRFDDYIAHTPRGLKWLFRIAGKFILGQYIKDIKQMDLVITNSSNTQKRLLDYTGINSTVIYPPVNTNRFKFVSQGDYFLSYARLDSDKRIPLIIDAFAQMPEKKLVLCSTGPLHNMVKVEIEKRNLTNISFEGLVTDERLNELVGSCLAGIYIPVNEDFGMTQIEIMAAGKPVIGVKEGGLLETILDGKTGLLIKTNPSAEDLIYAVRNLTPQIADEMKENCIIQAGNFSLPIFFDKFEKELSALFIKKNRMGL